MAVSKRRKGPHRRGPGGLLSRLDSAYRSMRTFRVVFGLKPVDGRLARATLSRLPVMTAHDRVLAFEAQTARIEAQLLVLEEDTGRARGEDAPAGLPLRRRSLAFTRLLLQAHLDAAARISKRTSAVSALREAFDRGRSAAHLDKAFLSGGSINLERVADLLFLYREVHARLHGPAKDGGEAEGVA